MSGNSVSSQRACFVLKVREERLADFVEAHQEVWPEYLRAFHAAGITRYTSWVTPDGLFVGYLEADDPGEALARLAASDVDVRWQLTMQPFFEDREGSKVNGLAFMAEIFDLQEARARLG